MSMAHFHQVEERLGKQTVKLLFDSARNGDISDDQMDSFADLLGSVWETQAKDGEGQRQGQACHAEVHPL